MKFTSLQAFVPSGNNFEGSKQFFKELGFNVSWDAGDYVGFDNNGHSFILQKFDNKEFAENFMLTVGVNNADEFRKEVLEKKLPEKFGIPSAKFLISLMGGKLILLTWPVFAGILYNPE